MAEKEEQGNCLEQGSSSPHEAIMFVLAYLPLFELLTMTRVCKSLRDAVNDDLLPWLKIVIDRPLNWRISDDILMQVTSRANRKLQFLALINCVNITDDGLLSVIAQNPHITKLHIPGCTSLSPGGVIRIVKLLKLESLQIYGIYGFNKEHLQTLHNLINPNQTRKIGKILYHEHKKSSTLKYKDTDRPIDIDICPKCDEITTIFDCPRITCENLQQRLVSECRGCSSCITRCTECGICITSDQELEEASCPDILCLDCWLRLPKCDFCNKPYCNLHADQKQRISGSAGFVCANCYSQD